MCEPKRSRPTDPSDRVRRTVTVARWLSAALLTLAASAVAVEPPFGSTPAADGDGSTATSRRVGRSVDDRPPGAEAATEDALKEQTVYVPYDTLQEIFEREGRGVFLPYARFKELWRAARAATVPPPDRGPPVGALITEIMSDATVERTRSDWSAVVRVSARVRLDVLTDGWHAIPLRLSDAALMSATVADAEGQWHPALMTTDDDGAHVLLLNTRGDEPRRIELRLEYAKAYTVAPGRNSVSFEAPQAPVNRWRVRIPERGVKVEIHPLIAATEVPSRTEPASSRSRPGSAGDGDEPNPGETVVLAFVGSADSVQIQWTPRAEGATGLKALVTVESDQRVRVHQGVVRTTARLTFDISRAPVDRLFIEVPADQKVVSVFDANIRQWSVEQDGSRGTVQRIAVELFEPTEGRQTVTVGLERFSSGDDDGPVEWTVPVVRAADVGRQRGVLAVSVAEGLRVEVARRFGLLQIDAGELPVDPRRPTDKSVRGRRPTGPGPRPLPPGGDAWVLSYRYATLPFDLALHVEKMEPRITADSLVEAYLTPGQLDLKVQAVYRIEKAGVFSLAWDVPEGYELRGGVHGLGMAGVQPVVIESWSIPVRDRTKLVVNLGRKATGRVGLRFNLSKRIQEPDLLSPTGKAAEVSVRVPRPTGDRIERATGRLIVYVPESLRLSPAVTDGLRAITLAEARSWTDGDGPAGRPADVGPAVRPADVGSAVRERRPDVTASVGLAFAFADEPVRLMVKAQRRRPHVTVRQLLTVGIEAGVVRYAATFHYDILYSGVQTLRIDVPAAPAGTIRNITPGVAETVIDPPPEDLADGYVAWSLRRDRGFKKGSASVTLAWETKLDGLEVGRSVDVAVPRLMPMGVDRAWGQIVLAKAETLDIQPSGGTGSEAPVGLRPIDPRYDLMEGAPAVGEGQRLSLPSPAARAFEFHDDWVLVIGVTRYRLEEVKRTSIERALVRTVVTRSDQLSVQALYRLRSARQRLAIVLPEGVEFDTDPVRINGRPVPLERGPRDAFFVPLVGRSPDEPIVLEIRYTVPDAGTRLACPAFPSEPAIQKVYVSAYLPPEWVFLGSTGPWSDELRWYWRDFFGFQPMPNTSDTGLVAWVTEGVRVSEDPAGSFQTDGRPYLFSALGPAPPPGGTLRLVTLDEDWLSAIVLLLVGAGGIGLLRAAAATRFLATGAFLVALVLTGVFLPTVSLQIIDGVMVSAILVVMIVWLVRYLAWTRPNDPDIIARKNARHDLRLARIQARAAGLRTGVRSGVRSGPHAGRSRPGASATPLFRGGGEPTPQAPVQDTAKPRRKEETPGDAAGGKDAPSPGDGGPSDA